MAFTDERRDVIKRTTNKRYKIKSETLTQCSRIIMVAPQADDCFEFFDIWDFWLRSWQNWRKNWILLQILIYFKKRITQNRLFFTILWHIYQADFGPYMCQSVKISVSSYKSLSKPIVHFSETLHHLNPKSLRSDGCMGINIDLVMFRRGREKWRGRNYSAICKPTITKIFPCGVLSCVDMYFLVWLLECHFPYSSKTLTVLLGLL